MQNNYCNSTRNGAFTHDDSFCFFKVYITKLRRLGCRASSVITCCGSITMSRWTDIRASPVSLSCPVAFLRNVLSLFSVENVLSAVAVDTGSVAKTFSRKWRFGKKSLLHNERDNTAEVGRSANGIFEHLTFQMSNSALTLSVASLQ